MQKTGNAVDLSNRVLVGMGEAPAALVGDFLVCRALAGSPARLASLLAESEEPIDRVEPVTREKIAEEGYFCGEWHPGCQVNVA